MFYQEFLPTLTPQQGIDWITVTSPKYDAITEDIADVESVWDPAGDMEKKVWNFFGYEGYSLGKFSWGYKEDAGIMQFSGGAATEGIKHIPASWKCTRIDLEASVFLKEEREMARIYFETLGGAARTTRPILRFISSSNDGGDTLYIGSRKSEQMGRIYDKGAERRIMSEGELGSRIYWRYEVELKGEKAREAYNALWFLKGDFKPQIAAFVYDWFIERGIVPVFKREGIDLVIESAVIEATEKDEFIRKLAWLVRCVTPVVQTLREQYTDYTILEALNLIE